MRLRRAFAAAVLVTSIAWATFLLAGFTALFYAVTRNPESHRPAAYEAPESRQPAPVASQEASATPRPALAMVPEAPRAERPDGSELEPRSDQPEERGGETARRREERQPTPYRVRTVGMGDHWPIMHVPARNQIMAAFEQATRAVEAE